MVQCVVGQLDRSADAAARGWGEADGQRACGTAASVAGLNELDVNIGHAVPLVPLRLKLVVETLGFVPVAGIGKVNGALPMFENMTVCGLSLLVDPTLVEAKVRLGPARARSSAHCPSRSRR